MSARRITRALVIAGVASLTLSACGGEPAGSTGEVGGDITYSFWGTPARAEKVGKVIDQFEAKHSGTTVTPEVADYAAYVERLTVRAAGGDLACAIGTQSTFVTGYADKNVLLPLDDLIKSGQISTKDIPEDVLRAGQIQGKQYLLPTGTFVRLVAYNADMVKEAGAPEPTDDMTWQDYATWLRQVQSGLPKGKYATEIEASNMFSFTSWVIGHGQQTFVDGKLGFDKQLMADWFQYWLDLTADGVTVPADKIPDQSLALELTPMATGLTAAGTRDIPHMYITEQALAKNKLGTSVKSISVPSESTDQSANVLGTNGISIPEKCDNPATAAAFIDHFTNDTDAALAFQSDNGILTNTVAQQALLDDANVPDGVKRNVTTLRELTDSGDLTNTTYPAGLTTLTNELLRLYQQVAFGRMSVDEAVDAYFTAADEALN